MEWQATVEDALQREIAAWRLTRLEANELHRRLDLLAFNMTAAGHEGELAKEVAASWLRYLRHRGLEKRPAVPLTKQARAARWWVQGAAAGLLYEHEDSIAFVDRGLQDYFCLHFCQTHPLNTHLLRRAARESFRDIWRRWAEHDPTLADQLNALLLGKRQTKGGLRAVLPLRYLSDTRAIDPLIVALNDPNDSVCIRAALALGTLGDPRALEPLTTRQAREERLSVRVPLIEALGSFGAPAIPILSALLEHPHQNVVRAGIRSLGRTDTTEAAATLIAILAGKGAHTTDLHVLQETLRKEIETTQNLLEKRFNPQASGESVSPAARREEIRALTARVSSYSDDPHRAEAAIRALGTLGERAIPALGATLNHDNRRVREHLARALSHTHSVRAAGPLLAQLKKEVTEHAPSDERAVGAALIELGCPESSDLLAEALAEPDAVVRSYVACALAELGDKRAVEPLLALLQEKDAHIRARAASGLGKLGDTRAVEPLIRALSAPEDNPPQRAADTPISGKPDLKRALEQLQSLHNPEQQARQQAAEALGKLGDARAVGPLIQALSHHNEWLRWHAASALGKIGDQQAIAPLVQALADSSDMVRQNAAYALGKLRAVEALLAVLQERGVDTPSAVISTLGNLKDKRAVEPLLALLQTFPSPRARESDEMKRRMMLQRDPRELKEHFRASMMTRDVKRNVIFALGYLGDPRAVEPLIELVKAGKTPPSLRLDSFEALQALVQIGHRRALDALLQLQRSQSTDGSIYSHIQDAIDRLSKHLGQQRQPS